MLTIEDLTKVKSLVSSEIQTEIKPLKKGNKDIKKALSSLQSDNKTIKKTLNLVVKLFDRDNVDLRNRVEKIEDQVGVFPDN